MGPSPDSRVFPRKRRGSWEGEVGEESPLAARFGSLCLSGVGIRAPVQAALRPVSFPVVDFVSAPLPPT